VFGERFVLSDFWHVRENSLFAMTRLDQRLLIAYDRCKQIALGHYENFPVGSLLVSRKLRPHIYALYAFMRTADDFADLRHRSSIERLQLLADWRAHLDRAIAGEFPSDPIFIALQHTIRTFNLPTDLFYLLLDAFEFDARGGGHFEKFEDLHWYTKRSAEPVGQLVLALFGYRDERRIQWSNDICTALQLLNFMQDAKDDLTESRYYFPREDYQRFGIQSANEILSSPQAGALVLHECERIATLLTSGARLPENVNGRLKFELRAVIHGAYSILRKIREVKGDTMGCRPKLSAGEQRSVLLTALFARPLKT
jgi:squalene synthase HpnC